MALAPSIAALHAAGHELGGVFLPGNAELYRADIVRPFVLPSLDAPAEPLIEIIGARHYDYALIATEKPVGYRIAYEAGIPQRAGFFNGWAKPFKSLWLLPRLNKRIARPVDDADMHEVESLFRLSLHLHGELRPVRDVRHLRPLFLAEEPERDRIVYVQMTAKWLALSAIHDLGILLRDVSHSLKPLGVDVQLLGIESERELIRRITTDSGLEARLFQSALPWIRAIGSASAIITPDTGAAHVAGALGTPVIDVFPPASTAAQRARWTPWAAPSVVLHVPSLGKLSSGCLIEAYSALFARGR